MNNIISQLEVLPNEIFICLFQYFDTQDLFQAFYNLNNRFNKLLQSLNYLSLTLLKIDSNKINNYEIFSSYIYTLKIDSTVNINLIQFNNIHRLILLSPTSNQLNQVVLNSLPYLEHLSIGYEHFLFSSYISDLCEKIFSNKFPHLISCYLFEPRFIEIIPTFNQSTNIRILKMDNIDLFIYKTILSLCPNLYFIQFTIIFNQNNEYEQINSHINLKRMIIKYQNLIKLFSDYVINSYISCVPNLEQLNIYEINFDINIQEYLHFNWFSLIINNYLPLIQRFKYFLYIYGMKQNDENIIQDIKKKFQYVHKKTISITTCSPSSLDLI